MWMSDVVIIVDRNNVDRNGLYDIAAAVVDAGATRCEVDESTHSIDATLPSDVISTVKVMEGVSYVRGVWNYFSDAPPATEMIPVPVPHSQNVA